ncbi:MAG: hypothetical protein M3R24_02995 [Chloroflexota bacterium]|nr:hypothetical protein [Chloroflexota bacterium]
MAAPTPCRSVRVYVSAVLVLLLAVSLPGFVHAQTPPLKVTITDLGTLGGRESAAYGINNKGQVVGSSYLVPDSEYPSAFLWEHGTMNLIDDDYSGVAFEINDYGQIVGYIMNFEDSQDEAVLWQNGTRLVLVPGGRANDIDEQGQVVGSERSSAFLWQNGTRIDLGTLGGYASGANALNEHGQIAGWSRSATGEQHAALWQNSTIIDLEILGLNIEANDINEQGQVVGSGYSDEEFIQHGFLWQNGTMTNLSTLGGNYSSAAAINDQGQIVGASNSIDGGAQHAVLWHNGVITDLGTLGGNSSAAYDINDQGQIVGVSQTATGEQHAVLWTITQPSATPQEQIQVIKAEVNDLIAAKVLNKGNGWALTTKLDGALIKLERGDKKAAANQLHAFVNQVEAFQKSKRLTRTQVQPLLDTARNIIEQLRQ